MTSEMRIEDIKSVLKQDKFVATSTAKGKEQVENLKDFLYEKVQKACMSEKDIKEFLDFTISMTHQYSLRNSMLLAAQGASQFVAPFGKIKKEGLALAAGSKAYSIIQPTTISALKKENKTILAYKLKDEEVDKYLKDGYTKTTIKSFKIGYVFDLADTNITNEQLPSVLQTLQNKKIPSCLEFDKIAKEIEKRGVSVEVIQMHNLAVNGYYHDAAKKIAISDRLSQAAQVKTLLHEFAHAELHCDEKGRDLSKAVKELQAETTAYLVSGYFGLDSSDKSFEYVNGHAAALSKEEFKNALDGALRASNNIITTIEKSLEIDKEKEIER